MSEASCPIARQDCGALGEISQRLDGVDSRLDRTDQELAELGRRVGGLVTEQTAKALLGAFDGISKRMRDVADGLVLANQRADKRDQDLRSELRTLTESVEKLVTSGGQ